MRDSQGVRKPYPLRLEPGFAKPHSSDKVNAHTTGPAKVGSGSKRFPYTSTWKGAFGEDEKSGAGRKKITHGYEGMLIGLDVGLPSLGPDSRLGKKCLGTGAIFKCPHSALVVKGLMSEYLPELRQRKLPQLAGLGMFLPHILWPKSASVHVVFQVIPDDVCLLKEQAHAGVRPRKK